MKPCGFSAKFRLLSQTEHDLNPTLIAFENQRIVNEVPLAFGRLFGQDVAVESMLPFNLSGAGQLETLLGSRVGFDFWHCCKQKCC